MDLEIACPKLKLTAKNQLFDHYFSKLNFLT